MLWFLVLCFSFLLRVFLKEKSVLWCHMCCLIKVLTLRENMCRICKYVQCSAEQGTMGEYREPYKAVLMCVLCMT